MNLKSVEVMFVSYEEQLDAILFHIVRDFRCNNDYYDYCHKVLFFLQKRQEKMKKEYEGEKRFFLQGQCSKTLKMTILNVSCHISFLSAF